MVELVVFYEQDIPLFQIALRVENGHVRNTLFALFFLLIFRRHWQEKLNCSLLFVLMLLRSESFNRKQLCQRKAIRIDRRRLP